MDLQSSLDSWPTYEIEPVSSCLRHLYVQALSIAVDCLNCGDLLGSLDGISILERAEIWVVDYYGDTRFCLGNKRSEIVGLYPDLLNTNVDPHIRLRQRQCQAAKSLPIRPGSSPLATTKQEKLLAHPLLLLGSQVGPEPESEPKTAEPFPAYMEPTLASAEEMDKIVDLRRRPPGEKPVMRVTAEDLRGSDILKVLPEFMAQIARSGGASAGQGSASRTPGLPTDPTTTSDGNCGHNDDDDDDGDNHQFELDEEQAQGRTHVEMEIVAGILEERGHGDGEDEEDFELAIPAAGTAPSATVAITDATAAAAAKAPPMIRALSSSDSESSSSDESSLPILQRDFDVETSLKMAAARPYLPAGRPARARSHSVSVSVPAPPTPLNPNELLSSAVETAAPAVSRPRPRPKPILEDSETSSSGTSSEEEEETSEEEGGGGDADADGMEGIEGGPPVPAPASGPSPPGRRIDYHPDEPRKRSCTETSLARDGGAESLSDRKRVRPLIEEIE
ncbi:hypothetical protein GGTG_00521 [Gaeumannomyces tritici R3-111a-1]|uniref:Uncharacterized protein n=1 Tax=Gaeumannomyces tritici (strain R3-111a-1) TaxID=644352 RepID=J3NGY5_GAET3|nr:hypothetical protein GGTG_00521 [Gaeumannomyces tritici R3-111a-1]EJT80525.1 hypothetical protein GGTG_00521 [Gaeumannomyces tritici R3-111a-1]